MPLQNTPAQAEMGGGCVTATHAQPYTKRWLVSTTLRPLYLRGRPGTHYTGGWVDVENGLAGTENLGRTGIRFPELPALSERLYRVRYPIFYR
jgi:hypothetical protein